MTFMVVVLMFVVIEQFAHVVLVFVNCRLSSFRDLTAMLCAPVSYMFGHATKHLLSEQPLGRRTDATNKAWKETTMHGEVDELESFDC